MSLVPDYRNTNFLDRNTSTSLNDWHYERNRSDTDWREILIYHFQSTQQTLTSINAMNTTIMDLRNELSQSRRGFSSNRRFLQDRLNYRPQRTRRTFHRQPFRQNGNRQRLLNFSNERTHHRQNSWRRRIPTAPPMSPERNRSSSRIRNRRSRFDQPQAIQQNHQAIQNSPERVPRMDSDDERI